MTPQRTRALTTLVLLGASLAACGGTSDRPLGSGSTPTLSPRLAALTPRDGHAVAPGDPMRVAPPLVGRVLPPGEQPARLRAMVGKSDGQLAAQLGEPDFRRVDGDAEIWQYRSPSCILDAFLYRGAGGLAIRHLETRSLDVRKADDDTCFVNLMAERATRPVSGSPPSPSSLPSDAADASALPASSPPPASSP